MKACTRSQYSMRSLLAAIVCFAVVFVAVRQVYLWLNFVPLTTAVNGANENLIPSIESSKLMLTQEEVITAIEQQLDTLPGEFVNEEARREHAEKLRIQIAPILKTRLLPRGSVLELEESGVATLQIPFNARTGYKFVIRHPALKRESPDRMHLDTSWRPEPGTNVHWDGSQWCAEQTQ